MKTKCISCKTGYEFPDEKVRKAGSGGLRVRCKKCRAVMVVSMGFSDDTDVETANDLPRPRRNLGPSEPEYTDIHGAVAPGPLPAEQGDDGQFHARKGVSRDVAGVELSSKNSVEAEKVWYAALAGESRGPFSKEELLRLAQTGKVRGSTLIWRPGFDEWTRIRSRSQEAHPELKWLRNSVVKRKRKERLMQSEAKRAMGIHPIHLQGSQDDEMDDDEILSEMVANDDDLPTPSMWSKENGKVIAAGALWGLLLLGAAVMIAHYS